MIFQDISVHILIFYSWFPNGLRKASAQMPHRKQIHMSMMLNAHLFYQIETSIIYMNQENRPATAVILSLIAGALIIVGGIVMFIMIASGFWWFDMNDHQFVMGGVGFSSGSMYVFAALGLLCGVIVLVGAIMLNSRPKEHNLWGALILVFSILSLVEMGGFIVGAILGVVGGILALSWRPITSQ